MTRDDIERMFDQTIDRDTWVSEHEQAEAYAMEIERAEQAIEVERMLMLECDLITDATECAACDLKKRCWELRGIQA